MIDDGAFWTLTILLGIGTFLIRFSFLGLVGSRALPEWLLVHLRYVGVAVFPALVVPMVVWPAATDGAVEPARIAAAIAAFAAGWRIGVVSAILVGMGALWLLQALF